MYENPACYSQVISSEHYNYRKFVFDVIYSMQHTSYVANQYPLSISPSFHIFAAAISMYISYNCNNSINSNVNIIILDSYQVWRLGGHLKQERHHFCIHFIKLYLKEEKKCHKLAPSIKHSTCV